MSTEAAAAAPPAPDALRARIQRATDDFEAQFRSGAEVEALLRARAGFFDRLLAELFRAMAWPETTEAQAPAVALIAVGGYGRGELHPHSDIDLLILHDPDPDGALEAAIERFVTLLWDLGLEIGHSVRTIADCREQARADLTVMTALIEARTVAGPERLRLAMNEALAADDVWPSKAFFKGKVAEQDARHERFDDTEYNLEPNVKRSPGGLRDVHMIGWIARRHFGTADLEPLISLGFLRISELLALTEGRQFLGRVRFGLHLLAGRAEDRLLIDYQRELAGLFGYTDEPGKLAVEQFMHDYFRHVMALRELNDLILQHFDEMIVRAGEEETVRPLNERFQVRNQYIETRDPDVFAKSPSALLELFHLMANDEGIEGVRAATIRQVRASLDLIDDAFRADPTNADLFMALLRSPNRLVSQLTRMRRYGVLGRYLPEFGRIVGQMQHDLFHIYTVDAHTMLVIRNGCGASATTSARERVPRRLPLSCTRDGEGRAALHCGPLSTTSPRGAAATTRNSAPSDVAAFCRAPSASTRRTRSSSTWLVEAQPLVMSSVSPAQGHRRSGGHRRLRSNEVRDLRSASTTSTRSPSPTSTRPTRRSGTAGGRR